VCCWVAVAALSCKCGGKRRFCGYASPVTAFCRVLVQFTAGFRGGGANRAVNGCFPPFSPSGDGDRPRRPAPDVQAWFFAFSPRLPLKRTTHPSLSRKNRPISPTYHATAAKIRRFYGYGAALRAYIPRGRVWPRSRGWLKRHFGRNPVRFTARCRVLGPRGGANRAVNGCFSPSTPVGDRLRRPMPDKRAHFFAFCAPFPAKTRPLRLVIPVKPPNPADIPRKRGGKSPDLRLWRNPPGTPRLRPLLAEIARLGKTAFLAVIRCGLPYLAGFRGREAA
jgi:hypothetical protein